jgi:hypothetical protein
VPRRAVPCCAVSACVPCHGVDVDRLFVCLRSLDRTSEALAFVHAINAARAEVGNSTGERIEAYIDARINPTGSVRSAMLPRRTHAQFHTHTRTVSHAQSHTHTRTVSHAQSHTHAHAQAHAHLLSNAFGGRCGGRGVLAGRGDAARLVSGATASRCSVKQLVGSRERASMAVADSPEDRDSSLGSDRRHLFSAIPTAHGGRRRPGGSRRCAPWPRTSCAAWKSFHWDECDREDSGVRRRGRLLRSALGRYGLALESA